jgi:aryl-alcohol dehydrogenase-like predicted oxidoreductase
MRFGENGYVADMPRTVALGGTQLVRVGLGTNRLADTPENRSFLEGAASTNVNFIDTAHLYAGGESERVIGATLAPFADDLVVATKGGFEGETGVEGLRA